MTEVSEQEWFDVCHAARYMIHSRVYAWIHGQVGYPQRVQVSDCVHDLESERIFDAVFGSMEGIVYAQNTETRVE